jgi:hypothetical protein
VQAVTLQLSNGLTFTSLSVQEGRTTGNFVRSKVRVINKTDWREQGNRVSIRLKLPKPWHQPSFYHHHRRTNTPSHISIRTPIKLIADSRPTLL